MKRRLICLLAVIVLSVSCFGSAAPLSSSTLHNGSRGESVRKLQQALIDLGYLNGKADGIFGNQTEKAVRAFQSAKKLTVDGLAGKKTQEILFSSKPTAGTTAAVPTAGSAPTPTPSPAAVTATGSSGGNLFSGNYATIRIKDQGQRVRIMQQALIRLKYLSGTADGIFGNKTLNAVLLFQKENNLTADGLAGKKTLAAIEKADKDGKARGTASATPSAPPAGTPAAPVTPVQTSTAPDGSRIRLLHWFNDVKPTLKGGQQLLIYDPSSGISWTLRIHACGRHCDAEPLTAKDTENMLKAFGGVNTWDQKGVYVKLPSGVWTIGSTHDMPHLSGHVTDNNFNGHLCVHFLRDMSEAEANDPKYGVANQKTIRTLWKSMTGEEIKN